ncbi:hypothetical protein SAY87_001383 [Trapa incisa]|uniref:Uncharacterized protein n=1 Tax=Trapa incisa TaxID=236973 RepID=A0AAN7GV65_9MYRT|nr:hypothetical protein SAY87_001383 [Trapa incisa]
MNQLLEEMCNEITLTMTVAFEEVKVALHRPSAILLVVSAILPGGTLEKYKKAYSDLTGAESASETSNTQFYQQEATKLRRQIRDTHIEEDKRAVDVADQRQQPPSMVLNHGLAYDSIQTQPYSQNLLSMNLLEPDGHHNYTQMDHQTALQLV